MLGIRTYYWAAFKKLPTVHKSHIPPAICFFNFHFICHDLPGRKCDQDCGVYFFLLSYVALHSSWAGQYMR